MAVSRSSRLSYRDESAYDGNRFLRQILAERRGVLLFALSSNTFKEIDGAVCART